MNFRKIVALLLILITVLSALSLPSSAAFSGNDRVVIVLDPGHGGGNIGTAAYGVGEKVYTMQLARLIKQRLDKNGSFITYLTRDGDWDLEICERGIYANSVSADALISLHFDGSTDTSQRGVTVYTSVFDKYALTKLGASIATSVANASGLSSNGVKRKADTEGYYWDSDRQWDIKKPSLGVLSDYYGIPTWAAKFGIKSMIVEHGFMSNAHDRDIICAGGTLEKMAKAEADAIIAYYTNHTHSYGSLQRDFPSNCVFQGKQSEHCTVCGHRRNVQMLPADPDNHYWESSVTVPAKCGVDGSVTRRCRITDNLIEKGYDIAPHTKTEVIPAPTQHNYVLTEEVAATHTEDGYRKYVCSYCSDTFRDILMAEGHTFDYVSYTAPTCTDGGGTLYRCAGCGQERTDAEAAVGHKYSVADDKKPTCTDAGYRLSKCSVCGYELKEELAALGHDTSLCEKAAPTCTEAGSLRGKCAVCKADIDEALEATGHSYKAAQTVEASCTEAGVQENVCSACGYKETQTIPAAGHRYLMTAYSAPTCDRGGSTDFVCESCGKIISGALKATGHIWKTDSETDTGLLHSGSRQLVCTVCNDSKTERIALSAESVVTYAFGILSVLALAAAATLLTVTLIKKKKHGQPLPGDSSEPLPVLPLETGTVLDGTKV